MLRAGRGVLLIGSSDAEHLSPDEICPLFLSPYHLRTAEQGRRFAALVAETVLAALCFARCCPMPSRSSGLRCQFQASVLRCRRVAPQWKWYDKLFDLVL
jgi:hypothetical protein